MKRLLAAMTAALRLPSGVRRDPDQPGIVGLAPWTEIWWAALVAPLVLLALISVGIVAAIAIVVRRARISRGVGPFLIGYGGLLAAWWVQNFVSVWASCASDPSFAGQGESTPVACFVAEISGQWFLTGVWAVFGSISGVGAFLVYRGYRHRRAAPLEPRLTHATA